jgi:hypothetical protein
VKAIEKPDGGREYVCWCEFHPDGQGELPHQPNLYVSERGFICHACGEKGGLRQLANRLGIEWERIPPEATYDYRDADGQLLFQAVRYPGKRFCFRRPDGKGGWIYDLKGVQRVLYRLPDILSNPDAVVYVVEGEKDADRLAKEGLVATTNPGGAGKWRDEYSHTLTDRDVVVVPDNDPPGLRHAAQVARSLIGAARSVKVVDPPGLAPKGDVSDWLNAGHTRAELEGLVQRATVYEAPTEEATGGTASVHKGERSRADRLVDLALAQGIELFHDDRGEPFAAMPELEGPRVVALDSRHFCNWLARLAYMTWGRAVGKETTQAALQCLDGIARFDRPEHRLHTRCAWHEGAIWIDMDGRRAIRVAPERWDIVEQPPILFRSFPAQKPLPEPARGGNPRRLLDLVNVRGPDAQALLLCYSVAALVPETPIPLLVLCGPQGAAKTTLLKMVKRVLDPSQIEVRGPIRDQEEFALAASQNRVLMLDNLNKVSAWLSDALCRVVQGEGWSTRRLYTNDEAVVFAYRCVVGLSGINLVAEEPDLLDRCLILPLEAISPEKRLDEEALWNDFQGACGDILGGLLDTLSRAMAIRHGLHVRRLPRMADFARWGAAAAEALGIGAANFMTAYERNVGRQNEAAVDESSVAQAVLWLMEDRTIWEGTVTQLLEALEELADERNMSSRARSWPKSPSWLGRKLREIAQNLLAMGIEVTEHRSGLRRLIGIRRLPENAVTDVTAVTSSPQAPQECLSGDGTVTATNPVPSLSPLPADCVREPYDANDGSDGISADSAAGPDGHAQVWPSEMADWPEEARIEYSERAGARIADGLGREEAERRAREDIVAKWGPGPCESPDASGGASDTQMTGAVDNGDGGSPENPR